MNKKSKLNNILEITLGVSIITIGYYFFLLPTKLVTGGIMGISIIIEDMIPFSPSIFLYICYGILITIGGILLGKEFLFRSLYGAILQPTIVFIFEELNIDPAFFFNTSEGVIIEIGQLFISLVFASILYGVGAGLMFKHNATTGGMDTVQKITHKFTKLPMSLCIYLTDGIIIFLGIYKFGILKGTFALVIMYLTGVIVDIVVTGGKSKKSLQIITSQSVAMKEMIYNLINRGVTETTVYGGYTLTEKKLLLCVLNNREYIKIKEEIYKIDPEAFLFLNSVNEVQGKGFSKAKIN